MNIQTEDLGTLSNEEGNLIKFILLEDGRLLFGKCKWHKDLGEIADIGVKVIGAGSIPEDIEGAGLDDEKWGNWKSTGYNVVTPIELRNPIRNAFLSKLN